MILTVTLNAAIDRTVAVPNFRLGHRHRAVESRTVAGGKGINVARALSLLGQPVIATGFVGGPTGTRVVEQLREEAVLTDFTRIAGETRINLAVIDPTSGEQTEINERGPAVSPEEVGPLRRAARLPGRRAPRSACSPGPCRPAPATTSTRAWSRTCASAGDRRRPRRRGRRDARGRARRRLGGHPERARGRGAGRPGVLRPRRPRRRASPSWSGSAPARRRSPGPTAASRWSARAPSGASSRSAPSRSTRSRRSAPATPSWPATSPAVYEGRSPEDCLAYGVACGAESTQHFGAGTVDRSQVERLLGEVHVHDLEVPAEV